ncbi:hypothetical protein R50345_06020 [Paenibacillus sp. FSL R5-0345]|uniref:hypothetical protein n=1 Tax=Paenibacillus sp. FSL R5-0345 TaxID=1536770 RepID=UPI0004F871CC|nr:hypothetical protein [Paenibacillus sp. FSL R5-0345]AIQ34218.1 hypothetical protein R50345_06020 [Paenibacillus sp. FSL R5-0345]
MSVTEIELLKQQKSEIENNIVAVNNGEKVGNAAALLDELNMITNQISDLEYRMKLQEQSEAIEQEHVTLVEETKVRTAYLLDTLEIEGLSISQLSASVEAYDILRQGLQSFIDGKDAKMLEQLKAAKEESAKVIADLKKQNDALSESVEVKNEQYVALKAAHNGLVDENKDLIAKRDAAASELEIANAEIERLKSEVNDLQIEKAIGARAATQVVSGSDDLKAKAEAYKQSIQYTLTPIYNLRWDEDTKPAKSFYLAEVAETGETIRFSWIQKSKYREVSPEQADTFRTEYLAKQEAEQVDTDSPGVLEMEEQPVTVQPFQEDSAGTVGGLAEESSDVAGETITRKEFNELAARVATIEANQGIGHTYKQVGEVA